MAKKKTHKEYLKELAVMNPRLQLLEDYAGTKNPILFSCLKHKEEHRAMPQNALKSGLACCKNDRYNKLNTYDFIKKSKEKFQKKFNYDLTEYFGADTSLIVGCSTHGFVNVKPSTHLKNKDDNSGCPICNQEIGLSKRTVGKFFKQTNEKICTGCLAKKPCSDFTQLKGTAQGFYSLCKVCSRKKTTIAKKTCGKSG